jgi:hypothetical protein
MFLSKTGNRKNNSRVLVWLTSKISFRGEITILASAAATRKVIEDRTMAGHLRFSKVFATLHDSRGLFF